MGNALMYLTTITVETFHLNNLSTLLKLLDLKNKLNKFSLLLPLQQHLMISTLLSSLKFSESVEMESLNHPFNNSTKYLILMEPDHLDLKILKKSQQVLVKISQQQKLIR